VGGPFGRSVFARMGSYVRAPARVASPALCDTPAGLWLGVWQHSLVLPVNGGDRLERENVPVLKQASGARRSRRGGRRGAGSERDRGARRASLLVQDELALGRGKQPAGLAPFSELTLREEGWSWASAASVFVPHARRRLTPSCGRKHEGHRRRRVLGRRRASTSSSFRYGSHRLYRVPGRGCFPDALCRVVEVQRQVSVEFGPSRSRRFGKALAEAQSGAGECSEVEPGRYRVRFALGENAGTYTGLGRLLERVRHWRATDVDEEDEPVSAFHAKEMAWCASFHLTTFGDCRERFEHGCFPAALSAPYLMRSGQSAPGYGKPGTGAELRDRPRPRTTLRSASARTTTKSALSPTR
jgi:hypothetical protein